MTHLRMDLLSEYNVAFDAIPKKVLWIGIRILVMFLGGENLQTQFL